MCAASPPRSTPVAPDPGAAVGTLHSGFEQRCATRSRSAALIDSLKLSRGIRQLCLSLRRRQLEAAFPLRNPTLKGSVSLDSLVSRNQGSPPPKILQERLDAGIQKQTSVNSSFWLETASLQSSANDSA